ncbi:hypothetical protein BSPWISOXPB_3685 [uncultured Gammaproteobacteria bacterium]|nr:hypothetical protein BSPWISOXPB_3685 [uncultured Gammaproteobacteria bacterium]
MQITTFGTRSIYAIVTDYRLNANHNEIVIVTDYP